MFLCQKHHRRVKKNNKFIYIGLILWHSDWLNIFILGA